MSKTVRKSRRNLDAASDSKTTTALSINEPTTDMEKYSKEVLNALIKDNLPPTPNNFSLYFDRLLEKKDENLRRKIRSILELEESNDDENNIALEENLKKGFSSVKNILTVTANVYKNMSLMLKILKKRKSELEISSDEKVTSGVTSALQNDILKLNEILTKQTTQMKTLYDDTATIVKSVDNETIFDNQFGIYNKRYLLTKIEQEKELIGEFNHKSSLIFIELSRELKKSVKSEKAIMLMTRTISRLLLKTSRRSDTVAHYGKGMFAMLLKHTDVDSAKKASERLCDLVSNSNFFLGEKEIQLKISIGVTNISTDHSVEEIVMSSINGVEKAYEDATQDYAVSLLSKIITVEKK